MTTPQQAWATQSMTRPTRALVVGAPVTDVESLARQVMQEGYIVDTVAEAGAVAARIRAGRFELVLLDLDLPGMDGPALVGTLRSDAELAAMPVIVVSAREDLVVVEQCLEKGADDYLPRAFRPAVLRVRVRASLDRRRLRETQGLQHEMSVARNIQRDFLPESLPTPRGMQLEALLQPARQVSGDFYDAFLLGSSGNIVLVVGDVCDKGVGAALFMALFRSLIRASADPVGGGAIQMIGGRRTIVRQSLEAATPADLLTRVAGFTNNYIARLHGRTNMFATVFMAVVDPVYGRFDYLNAGHEPALVVAPDGSVQELRPTGPALGMMPDSVFTAKGGTLEPGHTLFAFTDGLVEARSPAGEAFGSERLRAFLRTNPADSASGLVKGVVDTLNAFSRQAEPHDDLTMLVARREA